jgi:hypothetical protein
MTKIEHPGQGDPLLNKALRQWQIRETLPPRFGEQVWQRIAREAAERPSQLWTQLFERIGQALARPPLAAAYLALLVFGGLAAGYWHARVANQRAAQQLEIRYVQMIDYYER